MDDGFGFYGLIARAAFGIQEAEKLLQSLGISRVLEIRAFAARFNHRHRVHSQSQKAEFWQPIGNPTR